MVHEFGLNYRLPDILCALGIGQLKRLSEFKNKKSAIFETYVNDFQNINGVQLPIKRPYANVTWHVFPIRVNPDKRTFLFNKLRGAGIGVQVNYIPAYWHPVFSSMGLKPGRFPKSDLFYAQEISLPMHTSLEPIQIQKVISAVLKSVS